MHYLTPAEALALQRAHRALKALDKRVSSAAYDYGIMPEASRVEYTRFLQQNYRRIRENAQLFERVDVASDAIFNLFSLGKALGCESCEQTITHLDEPNWGGPQFSVRDEEVR